MSRLHLWLTQRRDPLERLYRRPSRTPKRTT